MDEKGGRGEGGLSSFSPPLGRGGKEQLFPLPPLGERKEKRRSRRPLGKGGGDLLRIIGSFPLSSGKKP